MDKFIDRLFSYFDRNFEAVFMWLTGALLFVIVLAIWSYNMFELFLAAR